MRSGNRIVQILEDDIKSRLQPRAVRFKVSRGDVLQESAAGIEYVYFPETAVLSVAVETIAGESVNVSLVGREGASGALEACGSRLSFGRLDVQIGGAVLRIPAGAYREIYDSSAALRRAMHKYVEIQVAEARQWVACNALHTVEARLARALLDAFDRTQDMTVYLTQDALSHLLGVQRSTVALAMSALQRLRLVRSGRGSLELLDIEALEHATCSCRATLAFARREILAAPHDGCDA